MLLTEWNWNDALQVSRDEGWEDGWEKGKEKGKEEDRKWIMGLFEEAKSMDELKRMIEAAPPN
jgi:flagellar biosynthesis/type III secretory pathway protein FliH